MSEVLLVDPETRGLELYVLRGGAARRARARCGALAGARRGVCPSDGPSAFRELVGGQRSDLTLRGRVGGSGRAGTGSEDSFTGWQSRRIPPGLLRTRAPPPAAQLGLERSRRCRAHCTLGPSPLKAQAVSSSKTRGSDRDACSGLSRNGRHPGRESARGMSAAEPILAGSTEQRPGRG